jgi:hypothetical protein
LKNRRIEHLELDAIKADTYENGGYQRKRDDKRIKSLAGKFNEALVDTPLVAKRPDGSLFVVDGQHTIGVLIAAGYKTYPCNVMDSLGRADEAPVFLATNSTGSARGKAVKPFERYCAGIAYGDQHFLRMKKIMESVGVTITGNAGSQKDKTNAIGTLHDLITKNSAGLDRAIMFIRKTWPTDNDAWTADMIRGYADFSRSLTDDQLEAAARRLKKKTCANISERASSVAKALGKHKRNCIADVLRSDAKFI